MVVTCLSDGVQVEIHITEKGFNGVLYVKGHSKNEQCRRVVSMAQDSSPKTEIFKVNFGNCGLIHINVSYFCLCVHTFSGVIRGSNCTPLIKVQSTYNDIIRIFHIMCLCLYVHAGPS